jgi:PAS domain S-box-containing protein
VLLHDLGERVKEINCLYAVSQLIADPDCTLEDVFQGTVDLIPPSWQYPEITCARIKFEGKEFKTSNWKAPEWVQSTDIITEREKVGVIEVAYLKQRPEIDEGPFLTEERKLIDGVAIILGDFIEHTKHEEEIKNAHQRLLTILDGINALVYVTDMQTYELLFVNKYGRKVWGGDIAGKICWETLQEGQSGPCSFCTNKYLVDKYGRPKQPYEWEFQNTVNKHWYFIIDRAIEWMDGRIVRLEIASDITERKKDQESIRESEERLRSVVETAKDGIVSINSKGNIIFWNKASEKIFGYTEKEALGKSLKKIMPKTFHDAHENGIKRLILKGRPKLIGRTVEVSALKRDGSEFPIELSLAKWKRGDDDFFTGIIRDITERKQLEEERSALLDISQNISKTLDLKRLLDIAVKKTAEAVEVDRISVILIDQDGKGTYQAAYSKRGKKITATKVIDIYDYTKLQEAIRKKKTVYVPDARDKKNQSPIDIELSKKLNIGAGVHIPLIFKRKVVGVINFIAVGRAREFQEHEIAFYETIANQLSAMIANAELYEEVKEAKRNLEKLVDERTRDLSKSEGKYRSLVESQDDTIFVVDSKGNFIFMNKGGLELTGYTGDEVLQLHFKDLIAPEHHKKISEQFKRHLKDFSTYRYETQILTKGGEKLDIEVVTTPLVEDDKIIAIQGIARDITERKKAEEEMKRRLMKFRLDDGNIYLVKEHLPTLSREVFMDLLKVGYKGLVLSRTPEREFRKVVEGDFEFLWLAEKDGSKTLSPKADKIESLIGSLPSKCDILIDRLDYLISKNGFKKTLTLVERLSEHAYAGDHVITLSIDPSVLGKRELRLLEKETMEVEQRLAGKLPEDLLEILKFVYSQNKMGVKPTYKSVGQELDQSQPTVRKKIRQLVNSGYLGEFTKGNSKVVELRERGRALFFK